MSDNMELWNKVCKTDPSHTKKVTMGRTFTAIDPMYQIMRATEEMGIAGTGWGWAVQDVKFLPTDEVAILVRMWRGNKNDFVEQWGQNGFYTDNAKSKTDKDCMKKATTDGITKCLTYFGFNADVFLGKFDDNKYVEELKKEQAKKEEPKKETPQNVYDKFVIALNKMKSMEMLNKFLIRQDIKDAMDKLFLDDKDLMDKLDKLVAQKNEDLAGKV